MCHVTCRWPWQPRPVMPCSWRPGPRTPPPRPGAGAEEQPSGCWGPQGGGELGPASPLPSPADEATLALMRTPRCSLPDLPAVAPARRRRQATAPAKWNKRSLSWRWGGALPGAEQTQWGATGTDSGRRVPRSWWRHRSPHLSHLCRLSPNRVPVPKPGQDAPGGTPRPGEATACPGDRPLSSPAPRRLRVRTFPRDSPLGRDTVRALMYYALKVWSDIAPLDFHEVAGSPADIQIDFSKADHADRYPFDGPGGTVAHAFLPGDRPTAGDAHFDDDEAWTFRSAGASELRLSLGTPTDPVRSQAAARSPPVFVSRRAWARHHLRHILLAERSQPRFWGTRAEPRGTAQRRGEAGPRGVGHTVA